MNLEKKPYLIVPKLIQQPTWGGTHIPCLKSWEEKTFFIDKKIGQSYELFGNSKIIFSLKTTRDPRFQPEVGWADREEIINELFTLKKNVDYFVLSEMVDAYPTFLLGKKIFEKFGKMPLLIKMTESQGNSYQLHIKPSVFHPRWRPKAESWYFFEDGLITFGIKPGSDLAEYKKTCQEIEKKMQFLSQRVVNKKLPLDQAEREAAAFIKKLNPRQFVNLYPIKKYSLVDLSPGGIHHSWEEDKRLCPEGNIVYEIQQDVMDPVCTIRCFDQGKFKKDGTVREINIDDYFNFLDTLPDHNRLENMLQKKVGENLLKTPYYSLDLLTIKNNRQEKTNDSFVHLFVREGEVEVIGPAGSVFLSAGHSCLIPEFVKIYEIKTKSITSVILKTYIS
jgi:mannose-6-phosphate isomerase class I